jgi:GNAT superfamily N-acetyltransferase
MDQPATIVTRDGAELTVRPIGASDREHLNLLFEQLSPETRYRRFLAPKQRLSEAELDALTVLDHHGREALIALDSHGRLVAVARYVGLDDRPGAAEVAVTVADRWQHRGVGFALLAQLIARAETEGINTFVASCWVDNRDMITLFQELGEAVRVTGHDAGTVDLEITLPRDFVPPPALGDDSGVRST